jgi:hypothetical protein
MPKRSSARTAAPASRGTGDPTTYVQNGAQEDMRPRDSTPWVDDSRERLREVSGRLLSKPVRSSVLHRLATSAWGRDAGLVAEALEFGLLKGTNAVLSELLKATTDIERRRTVARQAAHGGSDPKPITRHPKERPPTDVPSNAPSGAKKS